MDVQGGKIYPASVTKWFLDLCWLAEVCVNISLRPVTGLQTPSLHMTHPRT